MSGPGLNHHPTPTATTTSDYGSSIDLADLSSPGEEGEGEDEEGERFNLESDYGSDIDLTDADLRLLDNYPTPPPPQPQTPLPQPLYPCLSELDPQDDLAQDPAPELPAAGAVKPVVKTSTRFARNGALVIEYDELVAAASPAQSTAVSVVDTEADADADAAVPALDTRSPFDRFRARRSQLSVTDLVSGVWCEQQFQYTLERGFKRRTPAMAIGTRIHKVLEEQVHKTVAVKITTREDAFGLKLFNMCQGLLSLEEQGMTRELDVFGYLGGVFVQGVIDEVTYMQTRARTIIPAPSSSSSSSSYSSSHFVDWPAPPQFPVRDRVAFITDTKTRATDRLPTSSQLRSAALQLMFYHRLLTLLPSVPFSGVLAHHSLDGDAAFSDRFLAQVASIPSAVSLDELLAKNSLHGLWSIVLRQLASAVPAVGGTVGVVFRAQGTGQVMARRAWGVDGEALESHLRSTIEWWRGERTSVGVDIEDAWKCRTCEFEETCTWRLAQLDKLAEEVRAKKMPKPTLRRKTRRAGVEGSGESDADAEEVRAKKMTKSTPRRKARRAGVKGEEGSGESDADAEESAGVSGSGSEGSVKARKKKARKLQSGGSAVEGKGAPESDGERKAKRKVRARGKPQKVEEPAA